MDHVAAFPAGGADRAGHEIGPVVDVVLCVTHHRRLARCSTRSVDSHYLISWNREHGEGIVVTQVGFRGEGKPCEITQVGEVSGVDAGRVERSRIVRNRFVDPLQR